MTSNGRSVVPPYARDVSPSPVRCSESANRMATPRLVASSAEMLSTIMMSIFEKSANRALRSRAVPLAIGTFLTSSAAGEEEDWGNASFINCSTRRSHGATDSRHLYIASLDEVSRLRFDMQALALVR